MSVIANFTDLPAGPVIEVDYIAKIPSEFLPRGFLNFVYPAMNKKIFHDSENHSLENLVLQQLVTIHGHSFWAPKVIGEKRQERQGVIEYIISPFDIYRKLFLDERHHQMRLLNIRTGIALSKISVDLFKRYFGNEAIPCWYAVAFTKFQGLNYVVPVVRVQRNSITRKEKVILRWYRFHRINFQMPVATL